MSRPVVPISTCYGCCKRLRQLRKQHLIELIISAYELRLIKESSRSCRNNSTELNWLGAAVAETNGKRKLVNFSRLGIGHRGQRELAFRETGGDNGAELTCRSSRAQCTRSCRSSPSRRVSVGTRARVPSAGCSSSPCRGSSWRRPQSCDLHHRTQVQ